MQSYRSRPFRSLSSVSFAVAPMLYSRRLVSWGCLRRVIQSYRSHPFRLLPFVSFAVVPVLHGRLVSLRRVNQRYSYHQADDLVRG